MSAPRVVCALAMLMLLGACSRGSMVTAEPPITAPTATGSAIATSSAATGSTLPSAREVASKATQLKRSTVPVLCWHQIREHRSGDSAYAKSITVPPKVLGRQLAAIRKAGYTAISPQQLHDYIAYGDPLPTKPIMLSFDDGWESEWLSGAPLVAKNDQTATFFITTMGIDADTWVSKKEIRAMVAQGFTVGGHSRTHKDERHLDTAGLKDEIGNSQKTLTKIVGEPIISYAYPYGAWNEDVLPALRKAGIEIAFQLADKPVSKKAPLLTQRRILMQSDFTGATIESLIEQIY
ncbi:MAG: polysaccharide deacetylase family protein [Candidatus Nanopelagicales bacterium]